MNDAFPPLWFRLPPGFYDIGPDDRPALEGTAALASGLAQLQVAQLLEQLDSLAQQQVLHTAIGLHPDDTSGLCSSLFSLSCRRTPAGNAQLAVARIALGIAKSPLWEESTCRFVDLPLSPSCCLATGTLALKQLERAVFQSRAALAHPDGQHVLIFDLTSASTEYKEAYTDMLEAIIHTASFTDPTPIAQTSRISELLL
ncbi:hypothetical protein [Streptomyces sp. NPDC089799]|uniref:hypothetical protein n=1 Tax=Streptomyces sp. NPDC089799 TaxID=3155066 RepID=UPI00342151AD